MVVRVPQPPPSSPPSQQSGPMVRVGRHGWDVLFKWFKGVPKLPERATTIANPGPTVAMDKDRSSDMLDRPQAADPSDGTVNAADSSPAKPARAPRRKRSKPVDALRPLTPLNLPHDNRHSHLIEVVEPRRRRDELILSPWNIRTFVGLLNEFQHADTLRRHGLPIRSKLLFCGPSGCGKTITAEVFAGELGLPLLIARLDTVISSFLGETAANIRKVFEAANRQPVVLFLDEFDALARSRTDTSEHNELRRVVNSLLMLIDRYAGRGFLVAASNLEQSLDSAIWRRFDDVVLFDLPDDRQIRQMLKLKTRNFPLNFNIEKKAVKLKGLSYADIERICLNAIKRSILKGSKYLLESEFSIAIRDEQRRQDIRLRLKPEYS
jgi:hypothetical protein